MNWLERVWRQCRRNRRRAKRGAAAREKLSYRWHRIWRSRMLRAAREEIRKNGPPEAPWQRFPKIPNSSSIGWRMGEGEGYLQFTFYPWWRSITPEQRAEYLEATNPPRDWREILSRWDTKLA